MPKGITMILVKRKMYLIATCALVFFFVGASQSLAGNLLSNPGFENDLHSWIQSGAGWQSQSQVVYAGQNAAQHTMPNLTEVGYYGFLAQAFDANVGQMYYATLYAKSDYSPIAQAAVGLQVAFLDSQNQILTFYQDIVGGQTDWKQLYVTATAPTGTAKVAFYAFAFGMYGDGASSGGQSYFDEAVLSLEYIAPPPEDFELDNPIFENGLHGWGIEGGNWQAQTHHVFIGNYAAQNTITMDLSAEEDSYYAALKQEFSTQQGDPVHATAWVKTDFNNNSSAVVGLKISVLDQDGTEISFLQDTVTGTSDWRQLKVSLIAPEGAAKIHYIVFVWANEGDSLADGGTAHIDNAYLDFIYINHLGMTGGEDVFPQEVAENSYYTGAASARTTILYLLGQSPSQDEIYSTYHWSGSGNDMLPGEIKTALNSEIGLPYHFSASYQTDDQAEAIANFVYWVDFLPMGGEYCPAKIPVYGALNWKTVRGISTNIKPHPAGQPMPDFTVYGLWINDPASSGLGFNVYQTIENFQLDYLPLVDGNYHAVHEIPAALDSRAFTQKTKHILSLASARPNPTLRNALLKQLRLWEKQEQGGMDSSLSLETIIASLPSELKMNFEFSSLLQKIQSINVYNVFWKDEVKDYAIISLSRMEPALYPIDGNNPILEKREDFLSRLQLLTPQKQASILIEVNLEDGSCQQATWAQEEEQYPKMTQDKALSLLEDHFNIQSLAKKEYFYRNMNVKEILEKISHVRLVWSRSFGTSRFHPSYEISFHDGRVFYVHPNGNVELIATDSHLIPFLSSRSE